MKKDKTKRKNNVGRKAGTNELTNGRTEKNSFEINEDSDNCSGSGDTAMVIV